MSDDSSLERLKAGLDSRNVRFKSAPRKTLHDIRNEVPRGWKAPPEPAMPRAPKKKVSFVTTIFIASVLFFVLAAGASAFFFVRGGQPVSANNISMELLGPTSVGGGDEFVLQLTMTNKNSVDLRSADLVVEFPDGTRSAANVSTPLPRTRESLGDIKSGETINKTIRASLFGEEGSDQVVKVTLEYRIDASNAVFNKKQDYHVTLNAAPVSLEVTAPTEAVSGQEVSFKVNLVSNAPAALTGLLLQAEYPFGFQYKDSSQKPKSGETIWDLGDLPPGGKRTITIKGTLTGQDGDERFFRFSIGTVDQANSKKLAVTYVMKPVSLSIQRPFLAAELSLDGSPAETAVVRSGKAVRADIQWVNNLPDPILDGQISVKITGSALDKNSVTVDQGFYRSGDNTIIWNGQTNAGLGNIPSGASGHLGFTFNTYGLASGQQLKNPELILEVSVGGKRVSGQNVPELITSSSQHSIRVATDLLLSSKITRTTGPFSNSGPIPPKAEKETTYTVTWTVVNSSNNTDDVRVMASLPTYVRFLGTVSPAGEKVSFTDLGHSVVWDLGTVTATGSGNAGREVSFQIGFTPSVTQVGSAPILINEQSITGIDRFTNAQVGINRPALSSRLTDPGFQFADGVVVQ